jgi:hypothetical protein
VSGLIGAGALAVALSGGAAATTEVSIPETAEIHATGTQIAIGASDAAFDAFLDRLMRAESNGRNDAKNPLSSALGPFQFIKSTFLDVMRRHFAADVGHLSERDILALRTDRGFARRAAEAFSKDNLDYLADRGLKPTFGHLRLAFLLGPVGAARVLEAPPSKPLQQILDHAVISANPFMRGKSASDLIARATRDVNPREVPRTVAAEAAPAVDRPEPAPAAVATAEPETATPPAQPARVAETEPAPAAETAPRAGSETRPSGPRRTAEAAGTGGYGTVRSSGGVAVINLTCDYKLASCRRWVDKQVAKISKVAAVSNGRGA